MMLTRHRFGTTLVTCAALLTGTVGASAMARATSNHQHAEALALDLSMKSIAIRSVRGAGNRTADVAALYRAALMAAGWTASDIEIVPVDDTVYFMARWPGSDPALKPIVLSGHMDVVEAKREDWARDPFAPTVEKGMILGRGASDMKVSGAIGLASLVELRRSGFKPRRSIVLAYSGDEETTMKTSALIAERLKNAEMVINQDGGGGTLDEASGKPLYWSWDGAEKTYGDFQLEVTNPGGHSSAPRPDNAIVQLARALEKIGTQPFPAEQNALTREYFAKAAAFEADEKVAAAMRAFAANPADSIAVTILRAHSQYVGKVGTTCVPTMVNAGHALNALPQRATANINCRIFPGHTRGEIAARLQAMIGQPEVTISDVTEGSLETDASPMRADFVAATTAAIHQAWGKDIAIVPTQASGASDSMFFRALGVPSYGASPMFSKDSEDFSHGLNERTPVRNIAPGIVYYVSLITRLAG